MIADLTSHLWQSTLFASAAGVLTIAFRKNQAKVRYWLWLAASFKFLIPFSLLIFLGGHLGWAPPAMRIAPSTVSLTVVQITQPFPISSSSEPGTPLNTHWPLIVFSVWACGLGAITLIQFSAWLRIRAAVRSSACLQIPIAVEVRSSPGLLEPGIVGLFKPILLLPDGIADRLTPPQFDAVLAHELSHVRRRDNLTAAIHMIVEALFWFHPLVWWIGVELVKERERACDEEVLRLGSEPKAYAEGILAVCKFYVESPLTCMPGVTGPNLKRRVELIMRNHIGNPLTVWRRLSLSTMGVMALLLPVVFGLASATSIRAESQAGGTGKPVFETISIKPNKSGLRWQTVGGGPAPGELKVFNETPQALIQTAYGIQDNQIEGAPNWLNANKYDIEAKVARLDKPEFNALSTLSFDELITLSDDVVRQRIGQADQPNLQALLADCFKLELHHETRNVPAYDLVAARDGIKVQESTPDDSHPHLRVINVGHSRISGQAIPMATLAKLLSEELGHTVLDKTTLTGRYDIDLQWASTEVQRKSVNLLSPDSPDPSIFTAIRNQLGLTLEPKEVPREFLVIDHAQEPSDN